MSEKGTQEIRIEMPALDKRVLSVVWQKMRQGAALVGQEHYIGQSMADHPQWFPIFETLDVLGGEDTLPDGTNPFVHLTFHVMIGSQIFNRAPKEAELFYRKRLKKGDSSHDIIHMMINVYQRHLVKSARQAQEGGQGGFNLRAYGNTLRRIWGLKTPQLWARLGIDYVPRAHEPPPNRD